ncbi:hypothetical protein PENTCL1PPCAC_17090, partial [Pristionchus entomophagus]
VMSRRTRSLQLQLFRALVVQFAVPFIFCLIPLGFIVIHPITGIRFGETGNKMRIMVSFFPIVDPIVVILIIDSPSSATFFFISLILDRKSRLLGSYRWLLLSFAIGDIIISVYHAYVLPTFYQIEFGLVVLTWEGLYQPPAIGFIYNTFYCLLFYEPFVLLTFHFMYRYLILINPNFLTRHPYGAVMFVVVGNLIFSAVIAFDSYLADLNSLENFFVDALFAEYGINMNSDPRPNIVPINYLFAIPFAICFIPFSAICLLPLTGFYFGETGNIMGILVSLFPAVDPFMVLFMIA